MTQKAKNKKALTGISVVVSSLLCPRKHCLSQAMEASRGPHSQWKLVEGHTVHVPFSHTCSHPGVGESQGVARNVSPSPGGTAPSAGSQTCAPISKGGHCQETANRPEAAVHNKEESLREIVWDGNRHQSQGLCTCGSSYLGIMRLECIDQEGRPAAPESPVLGKEHLSSSITTSGPTITSLLPALFSL